MAVPSIFMQQCSINIHATMFHQYSCNNVQSIFIQCSINIHTTKKCLYFFVLGLLLLLQIWAPQSTPYQWRTEKDWIMLKKMQVLHILALLMSSHRLTLTKWQDLQPCFHDFQRSVLNTLDHKSKGKTAVGVFCISFLSTGQGMLPRLRSPLSSSFFQGQHPNFPPDAENLDRLQEKRKWLHTKHAIASSWTQFTGDTIGRSRSGGVPVAQVAWVAGAAGLEQARRITVTARVTASAVLHPHQVWPMGKGVNNHLFSSVTTSTVTYLPYSVHQQSLV